MTLRDPREGSGTLVPGASGHAGDGVAGVVGELGDDPVATFLEAEAGILAVEAYHASLVRTVLLGKGLEDAVGAISDARDSLDGPTDLDQGIVNADGTANIVPTDDNGIAFSRDVFQVPNIVYLTPREADRGGFFPNGTNGTFTTSGDQT